MESNKKKFDKEYSTQYIPEVDYLDSHGIKYDFVFRNDYNIRTYKYTKTHKLFSVLMNFYK